jgi:glycosyltransferase involved in cell wall biosynthesis
VDDASTDRSFDLLANLVETDGRLKVIRLRRNFGQTAALSAGFDEAQGNVIISLDGDLQHAPEDIPALLAKIEEGYDIASGWRKDRVDNAITRKIPFAHRELADGEIIRVALRDFGTTFKAYRAEVLKDINLYGELHRFIPALASFYGARIAEVPSQHAARGGRFALRPGPHLQRDVRHPDHQVPAEVFHAPDALLRPAGIGGISRSDS